MEFVLLVSVGPVGQAWGDQGLDPSATMHSTVYGLASSGGGMDLSGHTSSTSAKNRDVYDNLGAELHWRG